MFYVYTAKCECVMVVLMQQELETQSKYGRNSDDLVVFNNIDQLIQNSLDTNSKKFYVSKVKSYVAAFIYTCNYEWGRKQQQRNFGAICSDSVKLCHNFFSQTEVSLILSSFLQQLSFQKFSTCSHLETCPSHRKPFPVINTPVSCSEGIVFQPQHSQVSL